MMVTANLEPLGQMGGNKKKCPITIYVDGARQLTREKPFAWPSVFLSGRWLKLPGNLPARWTAMMTRVLS
jgi:hypothetical protein